MGQDTKTKDAVCCDWFAAQILSGQIWLREDGFWWNGDHGNTSWGPDGPPEPPEPDEPMPVCPKCYVATNSPTYKVGPKHPEPDEIPEWLISTASRLRRKLEMVPWVTNEMTKALILESMEKEGVPRDMVKNFMFGVTNERHQINGFVILVGFSLAFYPPTKSEIYEVRAVWVDKRPQAVLKFSVNRR